MPVRVQGAVAKYSSFVFSEIDVSSRASRSLQRDVRVVTNVERNAVDVLAPTDERRVTRTAKPRGPGAPMQALSSADVMIRKRRWQTSWFTEESAE